MKKIPQIALKTSSGTTLLLQLLLHNQSKETFLLHPKLEDWLVDGEKIISPISEIEPVYIFLAEGEEKTQKMKLQIPSDLQPGQILKSWLRFPGIQEEAIPVQVEIIKYDKESPAVVDLFIEVTLPIWTQESRQSGILGLMSGLMDFEQIPMRWLVAEILVKLCQIGTEYGKSKAGRELLDQLRPTPFFKEGVIALEQVQFADWMAKSLANIKSILKGEKGQRSLLYLWECWWFSLAEVDLEVGESGSTIGVPPFLAEEFLTELGRGDERRGSAFSLADPWFAGITLGLAQLSPAIAVTLQNIASQRQKAFEPLTERSLPSSYNLVTGLSGFDLLPVRWLVMELLFLVSQKGREFLQTEPGAQLLTRLSRTRFFKNGVIAFASAQVPRWLAISQAAANAYYESLGFPSSSRGILYYWENWLWSLGGVNVNSTRINNHFLSTCDNQREMSAEQWFGAIALGLVQLSPRIAIKLNEIAAQAPVPPVKIPPPIKPVNDVLGEAGSLQR